MIFTKQRFSIQICSWLNPYTVATLCRNSAICCLIPESWKKVKKKQLLDAKSIFQHSVNFQVNIQSPLHYKPKQFLMHPDAEKDCEHFCTTYYNLYARRYIRVNNRSVENKIRSQQFNFVNTKSVTMLHRLQLYKQLDFHRRISFSHICGYSSNTLKLQFFSEPKTLNKGNR